MEYLPIRAEAKFGVTKEIKEVREITDHKNFAPFTNKIETVGVFRRKTFAVICDGKGNMRFERLGSETLRIRENINAISQLAEARDNGHITQAQFEEMRTTIIEKIRREM